MHISDKSNVIPRHTERSEEEQNLARACGYRNPEHRSTPTLKEQLNGGGTPLSVFQQQMWRGVQRGGDSPPYNRSLVLERTGPLAIDVLEKSLLEIARRHRVLRTSVCMVSGNPVQTVSDGAIRVRVTEISGPREGRDRAAILRQAIEKEVRQPFDPQGPLMRVHLLRVSEEYHILVFTLHALIADEWSVKILAHELDCLYQAYSDSADSPLPNLGCQYLELADSQRSRLESGALERHIWYWRERLAGSPPPLELPADRARPLFPTFHRASVTQAYSTDLSESLQVLSREEGVTPFTVMLAGFKALLSRYTTQDDIVIGSIVDGRQEQGTESLIAPLSYTVPIRTDVTGDPSFRELLHRLKNCARQDEQHREVPFDYFAGDIEPARDLTTNPFWRILFSPMPPFSPLSPGWRVIDTDTSTPGMDLQIQMCDGANGIHARFTYDADLFDETTVTRMAAHYETLLQGIVENADRPLSTLPLLTDSERQQILYEWNNTATSYPQDKCSHELFEEQVRRTPAATAIIFENCSITYGELNSRANQLAHHLRRLGAAPETLIGICVERSIYMVAGLLGILKAGSAYVPLDPQYPLSRLNLMLEDSGLNLLVTEERLRSKFSGFTGRLVCLDSEDLTGESPDNCAPLAKPEHLAYVIYTSGSTGTPKGVAIPHRGLVNFLCSMRRQPGITAEDTMLAVTTVSFDIATLELYLPLIVGARVALASRETAADGRKLQELMTRAGATIMQATPATWRLLIDAGWSGTPNLKILCGGEAMPRDLAGELLKRSSELWNMYGPTETTVWSTVSRITSKDGPITIGRPIANTTVYILDAHFQPVPAGISGELCIGGEGLARGYLNRPELTAEKFIAHPCSGRDSATPVYRTGDLARYRRNGEIECLGRIDNQVKVRGFRIELGEIESVLKEHSNVRQNAVIAREDTSGDKRLVAYIVAVNGTSPAPNELRTFLKKKLPDYMVPSHFLFINKLPLTPNGKVDRRALPKPEEDDSIEQKQCVAPRDDCESRLLKIWISVLGTRAISIQDNFFDLGGHSLLIAKLSHRIDQAFGKQLSMTAIFEAPTIEQQAAVIRGSRTVSVTSAIVPVQSAGSRPPLLCCGFDSGPIFLPLARHLGSDQPLLCIGLTPLEASQLSTPYKMEDIAARVVKRIRELQPEGPYYLGGLCAGGLMAYETARQLTEQGQHVALLALFEPQTPLTHAETSKRSVSSFLAQKLTFHLRYMRQLHLKEALPYIHKRLITLKQRIRRLTWHTLYNLYSGTKAGRIRMLGDVLYLAADAYRPRSYPGRLVLFQAMIRPSGEEWDEQFRWQALANTVEVQEIPGYHDSILLEPHVESLANRLKPYLSQSGVPAEPGRPLTAGTRG